MKLRTKHLTHPCPLGHLLDPDLKPTGLCLTSRGADDAKQGTTALRDQKVSARVKSLCSNALATRWISFRVAPAAVATARQVAVTKATCFTIALASLDPRLKYSALETARSMSHVASSRLTFVVRMH